MKNASPNCSKKTGKRMNDWQKAQRMIFTLASSVGSVFVFPALSYAGDAATLIFKSGQVILIDNGYRQIVDSMKSLNNTRLEHKIISLDIGGGEFLLNLAEVVSVCRDDCRTMRFLHQLDPARELPEEETRNRPEERR